MASGRGGTAPGGWAIVGYVEVLRSATIHLPGPLTAERLTEHARIIRDIAHAGAEKVDDWLLYPVQGHLWILVLFKSNWRSCSAVASSGSWTATM